MKVVDFQHEILHITVAVSFPFNNLDAIVNPLDLSSRNGKVKVIEDANSVST